MYKATHVPRAALLTLLLTAGLAAVALAADPPNAGKGASEVYAKLRLRFTATGEALRTGFVWEASQRPVGAGEQPPPVRRTRIRFPKGTRIDTGAVTRCAATDEQLTQLGRGACPAKSLIGEGAATIYIGTPDHLNADMALFNAKDSVILLVQTETGTVLRILRATAKGTVFDATLPKVPLAGGKEASFTSVSLTVRAAGTKTRPLIRTPRTCPRSERWRFVYDIDYDDPPGDQAPYWLSRCRR